MISGDFLELGLWGGLGSRSASFGLLVGCGGFWHGWDHLARFFITPPLKTQLRVRGFGHLGTRLILRIKAQITIMMPPKP